MMTKKRFLTIYIAIVLLLAVVRWLFPAIATGAGDAETPQLAAADTVAADRLTTATDSCHDHNRSLALTGKRKHRILSVANYKTAFPDSNDLQLTAAERWGVLTVKNRNEAERRKKELVYVAASPYYHVDRLGASIPYLVPRAAILLQDIGHAFFDSLYVKGVPLHRFIVTSVLRTEDDVNRLRRYNANATEKSCHLYGTTFDICYNRYKTVQPPDGPPRRLVRDDTLKWVLSEVLRDKREEKRCYIKYEVKQGCFHITVR